MHSLYQFVYVSEDTIVIHIQLHQIHQNLLVVNAHHIIVSSRLMLSGSRYH